MRQIQTSLAFGAARTPCNSASDIFKPKLLPYQLVHLEIKV